MTFIQLKRLYYRRPNTPVDYALAHVFGPLVARFGRGEHGGFRSERLGSIYYAADFAE